MDASDAHVEVEPSGIDEIVVDRLTALFRAEYQPMVRLAYLLIGDTHQAEEIVQDAFAKVQVRAARIDEPGAYLRRCVVNGCHDRQRRRRRADAVDHLLAPVDREAGAPTDHVVDAVRALPRRRRTAVVLRYYLDWSERDIAAAMGVRPGTVKALVHQGLADLRKVIEP